MSALVTITSAEVKNVLLIPTLSLVHEGDNQYIYLKEEKDYIKQKVEIGIMNNFQVQVTN